MFSFCFHTTDFYLFCNQPDTVTSYSHRLFPQCFIRSCHTSCVNPPPFAAQFCQTDLCGTYSDLCLLVAPIRCMFLLGWAKKHRNALSQAYDDKLYYYYGCKGNLCVVFDFERSTDGLADSRLDGTVNHDKVSYQKGSFCNWRGFRWAF